MKKLLLFTLVLMGACKIQASSQNCQQLMNAYRSANAALSQEQEESTLVPAVTAVNTAQAQYIEALALYNAAKEALTAKQSAYHKQVSYSVLQTNYINAATALQNAVTALQNAGKSYSNVSNDYYTALQTATALWYTMKDECGI